MTPLHIFTVMKSGGEYKPEYVNTLYRQCVEHVKQDFVFHSLTDIPDSKAWDANIVRHKLLHDWPTWWSKMELYRPEFQLGNNLYIDTDMVVIQDIAQMLLGVKYAGLWTYEELYFKEVNSSAFMYWNVDLSDVYRQFVSFSDRLSVTHGKNPRSILYKAVNRNGILANCQFGDQDFLSLCIRKLGISDGFFSNEYFIYIKDNHQLKKDLFPARETCCVIIGAGNVRPWSHSVQVESVRSRVMECKNT